MRSDRYIAPAIAPVLRPGLMPDRLAIVVLLIAALVVGCGAPATFPTAPAELAPTSVPAATAVPASPAIESASPASPTSALEASLSTPVGLVFDARGNLYVSQCAQDHSLIDRIDSSGRLVRFAGTGPIDFSGDGGPATLAAIGCPVGMAFGPGGALYFADHVNNRVRRIDAAGIITTVAGNGPAGVNQGSFSGDGGPAVEATLQEPWDVAFDRDGDLFIADRDNHRIRMVDPDGRISTVAGDGTRRFAGDGDSATEASLAAPLGVTLDAVGNLLIADSGNDRVRKVDLEGRLSTYVGTGAAGPRGDGGPASEATINEPNEFAFDASGALLVSTTGGIRRIDAAGVISTIVDPSQIGQPAGLAVDDAGNLYVADGYRTVYQIDPKGILTRFAGTSSP